MIDNITLDYRACICRFDGMICTVDVTCPIHHSYDFTRADAEIVRRCADGCDGTLYAKDDDRVYADGIEIRMRDVARLWSLADRIEALLPRETP